MRTLAARGAALALVAAIGNAAVIGASHGQGVPTPPSVTKQALGPNGAPLTGPVSVGQTIQYVLSYNPGTSPLSQVTIDDTLSPNLVYVNPSIVAPPGWSWTTPPYGVGNHEVYSNPGFGPGTSFIVNVPVTNLAQLAPSGGDGFYPIPFGGNVFAIFHHKDYGTAKIYCWDLLSLVQCPGSYPRSLDTSPTDPDRRTTPQTVRTVVAGSRIYYPSAGFNPNSGTTTLGIGCWDTGNGTPCAFIPIRSLSGRYEGNGPAGSAPLYPVIAGVVAEPNDPNRLFMYAVDRVYCVDVTVPTAPIACAGWSPPILAGTGSQRLDMIVGEGTQARLYVHYGITLNNKTTVACLNASDGSRCWSADAQATLDATQSVYGSLSPALDNSGTMMTAVCLHPYTGGPATDTMVCFSALNGGSAGVISAGFGTAMSTHNVITAFRIPNTPQVLYAQYQDLPSPISCFDFSTNLPCVPFAPAWTLNPSQFEDYGYAVDPAAPDRCLLGLGNKGILWRFVRDGSFDANGCVKRVEQTFDINSFFCAVKPKTATWDSIVIHNRPPQLTGGTINLVGSSGPLIPPITVGAAITYPVNIPATGANNQVTVQFTPTYNGQPTAGYQLELTFTADVNPQICYQATVKACGPVSNNATMAGSLISANAPVPVPFSTTAGVNLGDAIGPTCEPGILKICKVAGPGIAVGTPFNFTVSTNTSHAVLSVPAGPAPGGTCMIGPSYPVGTQVGVTETPIPAGDTVSSITVAPLGQVVHTSLAAGSVSVIIGSGVTEVTYTDQRTGFLEICKRGDVTGNFTFTVSPSGLGPFVVPAGACSPAIEVAAGPIIINEQTPGAIIVGCATIPAAQQGPCTASTSTVNVVPGDVSTMTIAFVTNRRRIIPPDGTARTGHTHATGITLACAPNPAPLGAPVTCTAKITAVGPTRETPTGTVGFTEGDTILAKVQVSSDDGTAALTTSTLAAGTHAIVATYGGDANFDQGVSLQVTATVTQP
jgi:uncharacterized repeat protein (TIGR01451 family)